MEGTPTPWTAATYISLGSLALSILSLVWNLLNTLYSNGVQRRVRAAALKLGEFGNIRTPITTALQAVGEKRKQISALKRSGASDEQVRNELKPLNTELAEAFSVLEDALSAANGSTFAEGDDWLTGFEGGQDKAYNAINRAYNPILDRSAFNRALDEFDAAMREMSATINGRIEAEVQKSLS